MRVFFLGGCFGFVLFLLIPACLVLLSSVGKKKTAAFFFSVPPAKILAAEKKRFFLLDENMVNIFFYSDENMEPYTFGILFAHPLAPAGADAVLPADRKVQQDARRRASAPRP